MIKKVPKPWQTWEPFWGCRNYDDCKYTRGIYPHDMYPRDMYPDGRIMPEIYYLDDLRWIYEGELE